MSETMELSQETLEQIGGYVKQNLGAWMQEAAPSAQTDPVLLERIVRVEEQLATTNQLMKQGFEDLRAQMRARADEVDKRFEQVDKRFEQVDKRFDVLTDQFNKRFEQVDKRFEDLGRHMNRWMTTLAFIVAIVGVAGTVVGVLLS